MFTPYRPTEQTCRYSLKRGNGLEQVNHYRSAGRCAAHGRATDVPVDEALQALDNADGEHSPTSHRVEPRINVRGGSKRGGEDVRRGDPVLDREVIRQLSCRRKLQAILPFAKS